MAVSVFGISSNVFADDSEEPTRYSVIATDTAAIRISGITANCSASLSASYSTSLKIKMELQKKKSGSYSTIKTWSDSRTGTVLGISGSKTINPLSTYRLKTTFTAGNETVVRYDYP